MKKSLLPLYGVFLSLILLFTACTTANSPKDNDGKLNVVTTTTMLADLAQVIGGENVLVKGLMGPGIDPHLYQASAGDVALLHNADVVIYNGMHLEGKMGDIFHSLSRQQRTVICIEDGMDDSVLLDSEEDYGVHDPHIWFDVSLWKMAAAFVAEGFSLIDPENSMQYQKNLEQYLIELDDLDTYIRKRVSEVPEKQRVLITAHDAFSYFGKAYGFEVMGLQGISTEAEAGTMDVSNLAAFISEHRIKAIFIESSVPPKGIEALQAAVKARGFDVSIGGELYSDSLGGENSGAGTYILTFKANIDTIVNALR